MYTDIVFLGGRGPGNIIGPSFIQGSYPPKKKPTKANKEKKKENQFGGAPQKEKVERLSGGTERLPGGYKRLPGG